MKENDLLAEILRLCAQHNLYVFHAYDSRRTTGHGFHDLVIVGRHAILFAELKTGLGRMTTEQARWRYRIIAAGGRHAVWTPADLVSGLIGATLREL